MGVVWVGVGGMVAVMAVGGGEHRERHPPLSLFGSHFFLSSVVVGVVGGWRLVIGGGRGGYLGW